MRHRHIGEGYEDTVEAVEDILARGSVGDWRDLAAAVSADPRGGTARSLRVVLDHVPMYGTTILWRWFLEELDARTPR
jgi:hypothetical protein